MVKQPLGPQILITLSPTAAFLIKTENAYFRATVLVGGQEIDTATVEWSTSDTTVARVGDNGWVRARDDGFAVLLARWGGAMGAAAVVVDTPEDSVSVSIVNWRHYQSNVAPFVEGDSVLLRFFAWADRENDLELRAVQLWETIRF